MWVELTLMCGAQDGREDLLGLRPTRGPISTAGLARDDRRPERVFGARQLVASIVVGSKRNVKSAGHSTVRCAANRRTSATVPG